RRRAGGSGRLFGSVGPADIAAAVREAGGPELDRRRLEGRDPIKTGGTHQGRGRLHPAGGAPARLGRSARYPVRRLSAATGAVGRSRGSGVPPAPLAWVGRRVRLPDAPPDAPPDALVDAPPDALEPGIHCVRTHWIRGFIAF